MFKCHAQPVAKEEYPLFAHRDDPDTSFDAAKTLVASGELTKQETEVWNWGRKFQTTAGITPKELASKLQSKHYGNYHAVYHKIQRRLSGLEQKSKVERFLVGDKQLVRNKSGVWRFI